MSNMFTSYITIIVQKVSKGASKYLKKHLVGTSNIKRMIYYMINSKNLVDLYEYSQGLIRVDMQYYKQGLPGSINVAYVRHEVADMLMQSAQSLPNGIYLKVWDAWRTFETQKHLYDTYFCDLKDKHPELSDGDILILTREFVSNPYDYQYLHGTGGAVDVTLVDMNGNDLDMGTIFDDFSDKANTNYFSKSNSSIHNNREMLLRAMLAAGFVNFSNEWWHYDYGDKLWATTTGSTPLYNVISTCK